MRRYAVVGLGQFGRQVALSLSQLGAEVTVVDENERLIESIRDQVDQASVLDARDEQAVASLGLSQMDVVVVAIGEDLEASVLVTALLVKLGVRRVVARASSDLHARILQAIGAHQVVVPEKDFAARFATELEQPERSALAVLDTGHQVVQFEANQSLWGQTLEQLRFRERYGLQMIAIRRRTPVVGPHGEIQHTEETVELPMGQDRIGKGDVLVLLGTDAAIERFEEEMGY